MSERKKTAIEAVLSAVVWLESIKKGSYIFQVLSDFLKAQISFPYQQPKPNVIMCDIGKAQNQTPHHLGSQLHFSVSHLIVLQY